MDHENSKWHRIDFADATSSDCGARKPYSIGVHFEGNCLGTGFQCEFLQSTTTTLVLARDSGVTASGRKGLITPHPFALRNAISGSKYPDSQAEAARLLQRYIQEDPLTDVGMMQINLRWNGARVKSPEMLLDPETNIAVAAQILCEALSVKRNDIELGIGGYHTMNPEREADARAYARNVLMIWRSLQALEKSGS